MDALFSDDSETFSLDSLGLSENVQTLPVEKIKVCSYQPRQDFNEEGLEELAQSIRQKGVLEPILVRPKGDFFEIVAGERRYRAALKANLKEIPVVQKDLSDVEAFEISMIEKDVRAHFKDLVYQTVIPRSVRIAEAPSHGKPILFYDLKSIGAQSYLELAKEVLTREGEI